MACGPLVVLLLHVFGSAWVAMLTYHAVTLGLGLRLASWGSRPPAHLVVVTGVASLVVTAVAGIACLPLLGVTSTTLERWGAWGAAPPADLWLLLYYALVNPWIEELFWRGARFTPASPPHASGALGVTVFWLFHVWVLGESFGLVAGTVVSLPVLLAGIVWAWMSRRSSGVWWSGASHQGANVGLVILYLWVLRFA